ncbi:hypothetical protein A4G26_20295 [Mycobacterium kansasii]|nr:hypothetical protein A4G26_20295 [Mycobacterium kansasii]KZS76472.1 hypothetical protein A4G29_25560 [Mycobacterium kansasii]
MAPGAHKRGSGGARHRSFKAAIRRGRVEVVEVQIVGLARGGDQRIGMSTRTGESRSWQIALDVEVTAVVTQFFQTKHYRGCAPTCGTVPAVGC